MPRDRDFLMKARHPRSEIEHSYAFKPGQFDRVVRATEEAVALLIRVQPVRELNNKDVQAALRGLTVTLDKLWALNEAQLDAILPLLLPAVESSGSLKAAFAQIKQRLDRLEIQRRGQGNWGKHGKREAEFVRGLIKSWINIVGDTKVGYTKDDCAYQIYKALIPTLKIRDPWDPKGGYADMEPVGIILRQGFEVAMNDLNKKPNQDYAQT